MIKKSHAKFSASGSYRWLNCLGSVALSEKAPPPVESPYAEEGTRAHAVLETVLSAKNPRVKAYGLEGEIPFDMLTAALDVHSFLEVLPKTAAILIETRVEFPGVGFGTVDIAVIDENPKEGKTLTVLDFKWGAGIAVEAKENTQLLYYACGLADLYHYDFDCVRLGIFQPRAPHPEGPWRWWTIDIKGLRKWRTRFITGVRRAKVKGAPLTAGEHCRFCPATVICPEISKGALQSARIDFKEKGHEIVEVEEPLPVPSDIENLGETLLAIERLEIWAEAVRHHAFQVMHQGKKVEGWKLVAKRSTRKWTDEKEVEKEAFEKFGDKVFSDPPLLSPSQMEKAIGDKEWVKAHVTDVSSGLTLVKDSDKRTQVNSAKDDFLEI